MNNEQINQTPEMENNEQPKIPGWADAKITADLPLQAIVEFANILNQRLCFIEDNIKLSDENGNSMSITQFYAMQQMEQMRMQAEQAEKENENKGE